jgi:hypothetical protein
MNQDHVNARTAKPRDGHDDSMNTKRTLASIFIVSSCCNVLP